LWVPRAGSQGEHKARPYDSIAGFSPAQFKNLRSPRDLTKENYESTHVPQLRRNESNKQQHKTLVRSMGWVGAPEFLEVAPRTELKESISLVRRDVNR
jgi:hypothetical protein